MSLNSRFIACAFNLKLFQSSRWRFWPSLKCSKLCIRDYYQKRVSFRCLMQELIFYHSRSFLKIYLKARHLVSVKDSRGLYLYFRTVLLILNRYCKTELCLHIYVKKTVCKMFRSNIVAIVTVIRRLQSCLLL